MVVGVGVCDTAAASCHSIEPAFVERLKCHEKRARSRDLLCVEQLLAAAELACGNIVLHIRDHHRDNGPGFRCTGDLGYHSNLHDLRFDLPEASVEPTSTCGDQNSSRSHHRIDHIAGPERKLLYAPVHTGTDDGLLKFYLGLRHRCFCTGLLCGQKGGNPLLRLLFCSGSGGNRTLSPRQIDLKLLDVAECDVPGIAPLKFSLGLEFVHGLLVGALSLLNLSFSLDYLGLRNQRLCVNLRNFAPRTLHGGLLLGAVQPENRRSFADWSVTPT